jgi:hypothetical protein
MKTYGGVEIQLQAFLTLSVDVSGQLHAAAILSPRNKSLVPTGQEAGYAPKPVSTRRRKLKSLVPA